MLLNFQNSEQNKPIFFMKHPALDIWLQQHQTEEYSY